MTERSTILEIRLPPTMSGETAHTLVTLLDDVLSQLFEAYGDEIIAETRRRPPSAGASNDADLPF